MSDIPPQIRQYALEHLRNQTPSEKRFHGLLRLLGFSYCTQYPLELAHGQWMIADFYLKKPRLVIEVDGGYHFGDRAMRWDIHKQLELEYRGIKVLHLLNDDAERMDLHGLVERIKEVYPTFPEIDDQMREGMYQWRRRNEPVYKRVVLTKKKKKISGRQRRRLEAQRLEWQQIQGSSAPCENTGDRAISLKV